MRTATAGEFTTVLKNKMKYLKIENNKGFYWDGKAYQEIDKINKDGLLFLLDSAEKDDFAIDSYREDLLANKAHQVIYENIHSKFEQFLSDKNQFKTEVDRLYKEAVDKYGVDESHDSSDGVEENQEEVDEIRPEDIPF